MGIIGKILMGVIQIREAAPLAVAGLRGMKTGIRSGLISILILTVLVLGFVGQANAAWYDSSWSKRQLITITGSTVGIVTNYAVKIDVAYDSDMQTDFDDIRFTSSNGTTTLDHWRGTYTNSGTGTFWVKIPSIPVSPGTVTIYMYYGNASVSSASNGTNTFVFFDDFESGNLSKWSSVNAPGSGDSVTASTDDKYAGLYSLKIVEGGNGGNYAGVYKNQAFPIEHLMLDFRFRATNAGASNPQWQFHENSPAWSAGWSNGGQIIWGHKDDEDKMQYYNGNWGDYSSGVGTTWHHYQGTFQFATEGNFPGKLYQDEVLQVTQATRINDAIISSGINYLRFNTDASQAGTAYIDDIIVRKYVSPEPAGASGSEESAPHSPTTYYVRSNGNNTNSGTGSLASQAWQTIDKAASTLQAGDTVFVAPGTYTEQVTLDYSGSSTARICFIADTDASEFSGVSAGNVTVDGSTYGFYGSNKDYITIQGFTVIITSDYGIMLENGCDYAIISENIVHDTDGAIALNGNNGIIRRNQVYNANTDDAVFVYGNSSGTIIENNFIRANSGDSSGLELWDCDGNGGGTPTNTIIRNNTLFNSSTTKGGYYINGAINTTFFNNIGRGSGSSRYLLRVESRSTGSFYSDYNDFYYTGGGNIFQWASTDYSNFSNYQTNSGQDSHSISSNPSLVSSTDLHIQSNSPCINIGTASFNSTSAPATDIDGDSRPGGAGYDMGADEIFANFFVLAPIGSQTAGAGFAITIAAKDGTTGATLTTYTGTANLSVTTGTMSPTQAVFTNGIWTGTITLTRASQNMNVMVADSTDSTMNGVSNSFVVAPSVGNKAIKVVSNVKGSFVESNFIRTVPGRSHKFTPRVCDIYGNLLDIQVPATATWTLIPESIGTLSFNGSEVTFIANPLIATYTVGYIVCHFNPTGTDTIIIDPNAPVVDGEGMAPDSMIPEPVNIDDLLKVVISGTRTETGTITWQMLDLKFSRAVGSTTLITTEFRTLFENIFFYLDSGGGTFSSTLDTRIATFTCGSIELNNGVATFTLPSTSDFQFKSPGTKTYFIVAEIGVNAWQQSINPRSFVVTMDVNGIAATPGTTLRNEVVWGAASSTTVNYSPPAAEVNSNGTYTVCTAKPPDITVSNTAPSSLKDNQQDDLFRIYMNNQGGTGGTEREFAYLKIRFTDSLGSPLGMTAVQGLFDSIKVYKDTGNNQFNVGSDTCVGTLTSAGFVVDTNGILTMNLEDNLLDLKMLSDGAYTYFAVVTMKGTASGQTPATFKANINAGASPSFVGVEDRDYDAYMGVTSGDSATATVSPIPPDAAINVFDTAPTSISDEDEDDLLKITVTNNAVTGAGAIELTNYLKIKFTKDSGGTNTLSTANAQALFSYISVYRDNNNNGIFDPGTDLLVGTYTPSLDSYGVQQISFVDDASTSTINPATSSNFFVAVKLTPSASIYIINTFVAGIDADNDAAVRDNDSNAVVGHNITSLVSSSVVTAVVKKPVVDVTDTAPITIGEGSKDDLLKIVLRNTSTSGTGTIEFAGLDVIWTTNGTGTPLNTSDAQGLFNKIYVYHDDNGDGAYGSSDDIICIGSVSSGSITLASNGSLTLTFTDGDSNAQVSPNGSQTYFLVVEIKGTASAAATRTFAATIYEELYPVVETADNDVRIPLSAGDNSTSTVTTAVPANPTVSVTNTAPGTGKMTDGQVEDLLKLVITHNGQTGSNQIEMASLTVTLTDGSSVLGSSNARALFGTISVYKDNGDGVFVLGSETLVGSKTGTDITGTPTITFADGSSIVAVSAGGTATYFVAVQLKADASGATPRTFAARIDGDSDVYLEDVNNDKPTNINAASQVTSGTVIAEGVPNNPNVLIENSKGTTTATWNDGQTDDLLRIRLGHNAAGEATDAAIEMASVVVKWNSGAGAVLYTPDAKALFEYIRVYLDTNGNDVYDESDTMVGSISQANIILSDNGTHSISFTDGDTNAQVLKSAGTRTYLLVVKLTSNAHSQNPDNFKATIDGSQVRVEDANTDNVLPLNATSIAISAIVTAATADPTVIVTNTAPGTTTADTIYGHIKNGQTDDLLRIKVSHNNVPTDTGFIFATATVNFNGTTTALSDAQARDLFGTVSIYYDADGDTNFSIAGDTLIVTVTGTGIGSLTIINLPDNANTRIATGTSKYYFLTVSLKGTASTAANTLFNAVIDGDQCTIRRLTGGATNTIQPADPATSTPTTMAVMNNPTVDADDYAATSTTMSDGEKEDLFKIKITHGETSGTAIRVGTMTVRLKDGAGNLLTDIQAGNLFSTVQLFVDTGNDGSWGSSTDTNMVGSASSIGSITNISVASSGTIAANGSQTYFLTVQLKTDASSATPDSFYAELVEDTGVRVLDADNLAGLDVTRTTGTVTSSVITIQGSIPEATVIATNTVPSDPYQIEDCEIDDLLKLTITHNGTGDDASMWLNQIRLRFTDWTNPLTTSMATATFGSISVYLDEGNGSFTVGEDTFIATSTISLDSGSMTISLTKATSTMIAAGITKNYFIVVRMKNDASTATTRTFDVAIDADADVVLKDVNLEALATVTITSQNMTNSFDLRAVPRDPEIIIIDTSPYTHPSSPYPTISDGETEDVLRIDIVNRGLITTADSIKFSTLTLKWGDTVDGTLTETEADKIFSDIAIYHDTNGDHNYSSGDTRVCSIATSSFSSNGMVTINLGVTNTTIPSMSTSTYLVVITAKSNAHLQSPNTFTVSCSESYSAGQVMVTSIKDNVRLQTLGSDTITTAGNVFTYGGGGTTLKADITDGTQTTILSVTPDGIEDRIEDGQQRAILSFKMIHMGVSSDSALKLAAARVKFTATADETNILTGTESTFMFNSWRLYRDNGDGVFGAGDNPAGMQGNCSLDSKGLGTITGYDNNEYSQVTYVQGSGTFFIVVELTDHASGGQGN
ncbi:MAG: DUF2341 domain-containing protein, partial [Nitrospirae bacterium]|nr:DUF2341 domain-containing protein [Nitrospirota bacterium]